LLKHIKGSPERKIEYQKGENFLSLTMTLLIDGTSVKEATDKSISIAENLIKKVEYSINGLEGFFEAVEIWNNKRNNKSEKFWHQTLKKYSWILSIAMNEPAIIFDDEAYIGGKNISNQNGNLIDFLFQNKLSNNVALIEIKTPQTKVLGKKYRNSFAISSECTGAINQLLHYRDSFQKEYYSILYASGGDFNLHSPSCFLIIGSLENMDAEERSCFELFRKNLSNITIITFDELFQKLFFILSIIQAKK
jgi:hypothetical protein